jgi:hypothetical protein
MGLLVTIPFWRKAEMIFGNIFGRPSASSGDHPDLSRACRGRLCRAGGIEAGTTCWPEPSAFARSPSTRQSGWAKFVLFTLSLAVERRISNRDYAPEWRR